jgi:hypothetical protein
VLSSIGVTLEEAFAELGTERGATPDEVRRAYLRLVKKRKPESDPDGFRRLREAYELLRHIGQAGAGVWVRTGAGAVIRVPAPETRPPSRPPQAEAAPAPDPVPVEVDATPNLVAQSVRLVAQDKLVEAAETLMRLYDAARVDTTIATPHPGLTVDLLLRLHERDAVETAAALQDGFKRWLDTTGDEVHLVREALAARWAVCVELSRLPRTLSPEVRAVMARTALTGNFDAALRQLHDLRATNAFKARADADLLRARPGGLGVQLANALARPVRQETKRSSVRPWAIIAPILFALSGLGRTMSCSSSSTPEDVPAAVSQFQTESIRLRQHLVPVRDAAKSLAEDAAAPDGGENGVAVIAQQLVVALDSADCPSALRRAGDLVSYTPHESAFRSRIESLARVVYRTCGGGLPPGLGAAP